MSKLSIVVRLSGSTAILVILSACGGEPKNTSNTTNPANRANTTTNSAGTPTSSNVAKTSSPFSRTVELHGIKFKVESPNSESNNKVTVTPSGLEITNEGFTKSVEGEVYEAEVGDLNVDRSPEVYIYVRKRGVSKGVSLVAYGANNRKSLSEIFLPELAPKQAAGYHSEDEFAVVENSLARRFPIFEGTGADARKTGKTRQLQYKLKRGEAGWVLSVYKTTEY